jgi:hypothetical protein
MACCSIKRDAFLIEKATNFKNYIMNYNPNQEVLDYLNTFDPSSLELTIATVLMPIKLSNTTDQVIDNLVSKLVIDPDNVAQVKNKIARYFDLFTSI